ncbi:MAG TPA: hypothetical protein VJ508_13675, partial [Saprospiraceae bacterium]|nr:hypothetical protein [Saprospiraceae bacterium]
MLSRLSPISLMVLLFTGICISWTACKPSSTTGTKSAGKTVTTGDFKGMKFEDIPGTDVKYARQYDSTGVLLIEGFVQNNKKVGQWIQYGSGGDLGLINNYVDGELEGVVLRYGFRNQVDLKSTYHRGQLNGPWIAYKFGKMVEE